MKLGPILPPKPMKLSIAVMPDLKGRLDRFAILHKTVCGEDVEISALIPHMLKAFLDSDAEFRRAEKNPLKQSSSRVKEIAREPESDLIVSAKDK